jgi:hypothetical protein
VANNRQQDWINVLLAIWLFISPWVLQFGFQVQTGAPGSTSQSASIGAIYNAAWNAWVLGVIVFFVALSASSRRDRWQSSGQEWISLVLGIWIFVAPWVLGFAGVGDQTAAWDHWITGALIFLVSSWNLSTISSVPMQQRRYD